MKTKENRSAADRRAWIHCSALCAALAAGSVFSSVASATDFTLLTTDRRANFTFNPVASEGKALIRVGRDRGLQTLEDPTVCPSSSSIRIRFYTTDQSLMEGGATAELPCGNWKASRSGYRYRDRSGMAGGVTKIRYSTSGLLVKAGTPGYQPVAGPAGFAQLKFTVGETNYMVRMHSFQRNEVSRIRVRKLSEEANDGEAAFWDTLWGISDRSEEARVLLAAASADDPRDGRSAFLLGMMNLYIFGRDTTDFRLATAEQIALVQEAADSFTLASPLLWDGEAGDTRVPGFYGSAYYLLGLLTDDPATTEQGSNAIAESVVANPLFNTFIPLGADPTIYSSEDPEYQALLSLLDDYFPEAAAQCADQGEICFNEGMAPHNLAGTFMFFGDVYAKGNRVEDARTQYQRSVTFGTSSGWRADFLAQAQDRLDNVESRVALYQDSDPANDPPLLGVSNDTCSKCHYQD
jgi:hypothetical protein